MKCCNCPALRTEGYEYPEDYCALGVDEDDLIEFKDGSLGCNRKSIKKIKADLNIQDKIECEAFSEMADSFVKYMNEQEAQENG